MITWIVFKIWLFTFIVIISPLILIVSFLLMGFKSFSLYKEMWQDLKNI